MLEKYLQEIGLNEKEAAIYLALLQVDNDSVVDISKKTKINRSTVYFVLEGLEKKGLVSEVQINKKVHYAAEPPERLETYVERQKVILDEHAARLKDIVPQIKSVQREKGERPLVKYFEGRDGAISAYTEFYDFEKGQEKDGYFALSVDLLFAVFNEAEIKKFREIRKGKDVSSVSVYNSKKGEYSFEKSKGAARLDETSYPITSDIAVIDDRVVISTLGNRVSSMLIKSKDVADTIKTLIRVIVDSKK